MNYGIKLQSCNRYIQWCDSHWYETVEGKSCLFETLDAALSAIKQLVDHYVFHVTLITPEGQVDYDFGKERIKPAVAPVTSKKKTTGVKFGDFSLF